MKGAKHQYFSPNEIPGYKSTKLFNPNMFLNGHKHRRDTNDKSSQQQQQQQQRMNSSTKSSIVNEIKINHYTSATSLSNGVGGGGGTYYDYLLRNQVLMYGQNHSHPRLSFNSIANIARSAYMPDYFSQQQNQNHHHHQHSSIYLTPSIVRPPHQPASSKYLQLPNVIQYNNSQVHQQQHQQQQTPPPSYSSYANDQAQIANFQQTPPTAPQPSASSVASQDLLTPVSTHVTYQVSNSNNSTGLKLRFSNNSLGNLNNGECVLIL